MLKSSSRLSKVISFNTDILTQHLYRILIPSMHVTCPANLIILCFDNYNVRGRVHLGFLPNTGNSFSYLLSLLFC
jgi:hypothetical protein